MAETISKSLPIDTKSKTDNDIEQESPTNSQASIKEPKYKDEDKLASNQGEVKRSTSKEDEDDSQESLGSQGTEKTDEPEELPIGQVTLENYKVLLEVLMEVKTKWYSLGTALKLDNEMLDDIQYVSRVKYTEYLKELLSLWLKKGKEEATWEKLREALINCYQKKLAAALEGKSGPVDMEVSELTTQLTNAVAVWKSLARELGVDSNLDEAIKCRYCMHTMIRKWILTNQKKANVDAIIRALEKSDIESGSLVEKLRTNPEIQTTYTIIPKMAATVLKD